MNRSIAAMVLIVVAWDNPLSHVFVPDVAVMLYSMELAKQWNNVELMQVLKCGKLPALAMNPN